MKYDMRPSPASAGRIHANTFFESPASLAKVDSHQGQVYGRRILAIEGPVQPRALYDQARITLDQMFDNLPRARIGRVGIDSFHQHPRRTDQIALSLETDAEVAERAGPRPIDIDGCTAVLFRLNMSVKLVETKTDVVVQHIFDLALSRPQRQR